MIKLFIIILFSVFIGILPSVASVESDYISNVEKSLYSVQFPSENTSKRLDRIEMTVFGVKSSKATSERINLLKNSVGTFSQGNSPQIVPDVKVQDVQSHNSIKYPVIDKIEETVFSKTFDKDDIYKRLDRIEIAVFNNKTTLSLDDRVNKLRDAVFGQDLSQSGQLDVNPATEGELIENVLEKLEQQTFNTVYSNESVEARLNRLEGHIFNSTSPDDKVQDRIERLVAVVSAQPASELYKDMSTIRQYNKAATAMTILLLILQGLL